MPQKIKKDISLTIHKNRKNDILLWQNIILRRKNKLLLESLDKTKGLLLPPRCHGFSMIGDDSVNTFSIAWKNNRYFVHFKLKQNLEIVHELITNVAAKSRCSCGNSLVLSDYSIGSYRTFKRINYYDFEGIYICPKCTTDKPSAISKMKNIFGKFMEYTSFEFNSSGPTIKIKKPSSK